MFSKLLYWFRRRWCAPRHAFSLYARLEPEQARVAAFHLNILVNRVNRHWFYGYPPQSLRIDSAAVGSGRFERFGDARVTFMLRRGGWNRILLEDGRLVPPELTNDLYPLDDFDACFPEGLWSEVPPTRSLSESEVS